MIVALLNRGCLAALLLFVGCVVVAAARAEARGVQESTGVASDEVPAEIHEASSGEPAADPATPSEEESYERGYDGIELVGKSDAERVTNLQRMIEIEEPKLVELRNALSDPAGEFSKADAEFRRRDAEHLELKNRHADLVEAGQEEAARELEDDLAASEKTHTLAKQRFELAIEERKTLQEQIQTTEQAVADMRRSLAKALGDVPDVPDPPAVAPPTAAPGATTTEAPATAAPAEKSSSTKSPTDAAMTAMLGMGALNAEASTPAGPESPAAPEAAAKPASKEVTKAQEIKQQKAEVAQEALQRVERIKEWLVGLTRRVELQQRQLETYRKRADNANDTRSALEELFREKTVTGAPQAELRQLMGQIEEAESRFREARLASRSQADRLVELQNEQSILQSELLRAQHAYELRQREFQAAKGYLEQLQNPLNPRNIIQWLVDHGPRIILIILSMLIFRTLIRLLSRRIVPLIASRGARGSREERENRAQTLVGVFENFVSVAIVIGGMLMLLEECGIPVVPLLGGAAVVGLAVAFGAQNLVRDYFYGFIMLLENQYKISDVVRLGDVSGQVEQITLRMTVLRDIEGNVHFVPNGTITRVTNMTHGWSRALFDISVAYKEDVDHVMDVVMQLGKDLRQDPAFRLLILEDPTMLGVDAFGDSGVTIRFFIKTRTLKQWEVKRELLRRIKRRFDELGIEIPFPQRVVYHRGIENDETAALRALADHPVIADRPHIFTHGSTKT